MQDVLVIRVADDAVLRLNSFARAVTGGAVVVEKRMRLREFARTDGELDDILGALEMEDGQRCRDDRDKYERNGKDGFDKCWVLEGPLYWSTRTYLISLLSLTIRIAVETFASAKISWENMMIGCTTSDCLYAEEALRNATNLAGDPNPMLQDFSKPCYYCIGRGGFGRSIAWHFAGIYEVSIPKRYKKP